MILKSIVSRLFLPAAAGMALLLASTSQAPTQQLPGQPDPDKGAELARRLCAGCHLPREGEPRLQGTADVPTFPEIARKEGQTAEHITGKILMPAHPMPSIQLTQGEIADLAAYILGLKKTP